mgnify:CR=1 FL=1
MDSIKSIAVPVTRREPAKKKPRRAGHPQQAPDGGVGGSVGLPRPAPRPLRPVGHHSFRVGQRLRVVGGGYQWSRQGGWCRVVALMPHEGGAFLYRIRSEVENFERVVAEADLVDDGELP